MFFRFGENADFNQLIARFRKSANSLFEHPGFGTK
jgi:hypothetical protein